MLMRIREFVHKLMKIKYKTTKTKPTIEIQAFDFSNKIVAVKVATEEIINQIAEKKSISFIFSKRKRTQCNEF